MYYVSLVLFRLQTPAQKKHSISQHLTTHVVLGPPSMVGVLVLTDKTGC